MKTFKLIVLIGMFFSLFICIIVLLSSNQDVQTDYVKGLTAFENEKFTDSLSFFERYISSGAEQNKEDAYYYAASAYYFLRNYGKAEQYFLQVRASNKNKVYSHYSLYFLGKTMFYSNQYKYAASFFKNFIDASDHKILLSYANFFMYESLIKLKDASLAKKYRMMYEQSIIKNELVNLSKETQTNVMVRYNEMYERYFVASTLLESYKEIILDLYSNKSKMQSFNGNEDKFREMYDELLDKYNSVTGENESLKNSIVRKDEEIASLKKEIDELKKSKEIGDDKKEISEIETHLKKKEAIIDMKMKILQNLIIVVQKKIDLLNALLGQSNETQQ